MRCSIYLVNCLRLWFINNGNFDNVEKSKFYKRLVEESKDNKIEDTIEFIYGALEYKNDQNMTSYKRAMKRKEVVENIDNNGYWFEQEEELGVDRASKVIELFEYLEVLGIRKTSGEGTNKFSFKGYDKFVEENRKLVDLFCSGAGEILSCLGNGKKSFNFRELRELVQSNSYSEFARKRKSIGMESSLLLDIKPSDSIRLLDKELYLPKEIISKYNKGFLLDCLFYSYVINANLIPNQCKSLAEDLISKSINPLQMSASDFQLLMDITYIVKKPIIEILSNFGYKFPSVDEMIEKSHGVYVYTDTELVYYIPDTCREFVGVPCILELDKFILLVNTGSYSEIVYSKGVPYIQGKSIGDLRYGG